MMNDYFIQRIHDTHWFVSFRDIKHLLVRAIPLSLCSVWWFWPLVLTLSVACMMAVASETTTRAHGNRVPSVCSLYTSYLIVSQVKQCHNQVRKNSLREWFCIQYVSQLGQRASTLKSHRLLKNKRNTELWLCILWMLCKPSWKNSSSSSDRDHGGLEVNNTNTSRNKFSW